jgi:hypothetical protein
MPSVARNRDVAMAYVNGVHGIKQIGEYFGLDYHKRHASLRRELEQFSST